MDGNIADIKRGRTILPVGVLDVTEKTIGIAQDVADKSIIFIIANLL